MEIELLIKLFKTGMSLKEVKGLFLRIGGYDMSRDELVEAVLAAQVDLLEQIKKAYIQFLVRKLDVVWLATEQQEQNFLYRNELEREVCGHIANRDHTFMYTYTFTQKETEAILICISNDGLMTDEMREGLASVLGVRKDIPARKIYA